MSTIKRERIEDFLVAVVPEQSSSKRQKLGEGSDAQLVHES